MEELVKRNSVGGTCHKLARYENRVLMTKNVDLIQDYFYQLGRLVSLTDFDIKSDVVHLNEPELFNEVNDLLIELNNMFGRGKQWDS